MDRKKPSVGTPDSSASFSSARTGSVMTSPSTSSRTDPFWPPLNRFSRRPSWLSPSSSSQVKVIATDGRTSASASQGTSPSSSAAELVTLRVRASSTARWIVDLPASLGPRTTVSPGASSIVVSL